MASQLTKWKLDIISESEMAKRLAEAKYQMSLIPGVTDTMAMALYQNGLTKVADVAETSADDLATVPGFNVEKAQEIIAKAKEVLASGQANVAMPEEMLDYKTRKSLKGHSKTDDEKSSGESSSSSMDSIEAKLRAELAAASQEKTKGNG